MRVLLVDDEKELLEQAKLFLERSNEGLTVETTTSAVEGLKLLDGEDFDATIVDYKMPGMNGLELLKKLRGRGNDIPFIILTGKGNEEVAMEALNQGADRYFEKGGDPEERYSALTELIFEEVKWRESDEESSEKPTAPNIKSEKVEKERKPDLAAFRHDLRNRIQITQGYLELLRDLDISDEAEEFVEKAMKATQEIDDLVKNMREDKD